MAGQGALKGSQTFVESFQIWIGSPAQYLGKSHGYGRYLGSGSSRTFRWVSTYVGRTVHSVNP